MKVTFRRKEDEIYFRSEKHKERFINAIQEMDKLSEGNHIYGEYASAIYIITSHLDIWEQASQYISRDGIKFPEMLQKEHFSSTRLELVKLATNMFNEYMKLDDDTPIRADMLQVVNLEESMFMVAVEAIKIRHYGLRLDDLKEA